MKLHHAVILLMVVCFASGCATGSSQRSVKTPCCTTNTLHTAFALTDKSLYQLDSTWTNDTGHSLKLSALQGRVQVVAMFFASCQYACPVIVHNMKRLEAALPKTAQTNVHFVLVTFDTQHDTPEALRTYREHQELPTDRWALLRAAPDDTLELAALLGVKYKREATGQFAHSNLITVLNANGEIIHQQAGLNRDINETVKAIERAVAAAQEHHPAHE